MRARRWILGAALALAAAPAAGQHVHAVPAPADTTDPRIASFLAVVRAATESYHEIDNAIAAGYRAMGPPMPHMGEHWVNPAVAVRREVDPARPAVLTYVRVAGAPVLTGVAYVAPVPPGAPVPPPPMPGAAWHYHGGDLAAEAFGTIDPVGDGGARMAMSHAWVWVENPDGLFAPENWALPYVAAGLPAPSHPDRDAARAMSLLSGGAAFYEAAVRHAAAADVANDVARLLAGRAPLVAALASRPGESTGDLAGLWRQLWSEVVALVPAGSRDRVARLGS